MNVALHSKIVILVAVAISVTTTFMTIRQSTKRGMTPQMTPDNPMAASQKYMQYFVPLFALSGLYWQFGLVLYWVTTNVWTLGQQYVLFKRYPPPTPAPSAAGAGAAGGTSPGSGRSGGKPGGGTGKPGAQPRKDGRPSPQPSANGGGVLRRLGRTRPAESEQKPAEPPAKIVRQQPQRQSRSKRSGKR
jgi:YidC/Oxa1 family membrane protein insertase